MTIWSFSATERSNIQILLNSSICTRAGIAEVSPLTAGVIAAARMISSGSKMRQELRFDTPLSPHVQSEKKCAPILRNRVLKKRGSPGRCVLRVQKIFQSDG